MGAACWRRAHEYAALEGEATEQEQRMAVSELRAELARLQALRDRQNESVAHTIFMVRQLRTVRGKMFHFNKAKSELGAQLEAVATTEARIAGVELALERIEDLALCVQFVRVMRLHVDALEACHAALIAVDAERVMRECDEAVEAHRLVCQILAEPLLSENPEFYEDAFDLEQPAGASEFREGVVNVLCDADEDDSMRELLALDPQPLPDLFGNSMLAGRMQSELDPRSVRSLMNRVDMAIRRPPTVASVLAN